MDGFQAYFDARIFNLPNNTEVLVIILLFFININFHIISSC